MSVFDYCPAFENNELLIILIDMDDLAGLYKVYSDEDAVPFFNSDNCHGDDFYYPTLEQMKKALKFWVDSYRKKYFVRLTIISKENLEVIGTLEAFHRDSNDAYNNTCLVRLDLRSDYEEASYVKDIFELIEIPFLNLFNTTTIVTKIPVYANERHEALTSIGYLASDKPLVGDDGTEYFNYYQKTFTKEAHVMKLFPSPYKAIRSGQKDIEMRLYDEKRRALKVNDELIFKCYPIGEEVRARIVALHLYKSFAGLYNAFPKTRIGYKENDNASPRDMYKYYSEANIRKYGVVGIEVELIK